MDETEAEGYAVAHVVRTLLVVYFTLDKPARRDALRGICEEDRLRVENAVDDVMSVIVRRREENPSPEELEQDFPSIDILVACRPPPGHMAEWWVPKSILTPETAKRYAYDHFAATVHKLYSGPDSIATVSAVAGRSRVDATLIYRAFLRIIYWLQDRAGTISWDSRSRIVRFDMPWTRLESQILYTIAGRLGDLHQPTATRLSDCRRHLADGLADLANIAGARELALNLEVPGNR